MSEDGQSSKEPELDFDSSDPSSSGSFPPTPEFNCSVDYLLRHHLYRGVQRVCNESLQKNPSSADAKFWRAFAMQSEGMFNESIRELNPLQQHDSMGLAVTASLMSAHSKNENKDKETITKLKDDLKKYSANTDERSLVFASRYFLHAGKDKQSKQCVEKCLTKNRRNVEALSLYGWVLMQTAAKNEKKIMQIFDSAIKLSNDKKDMMALLGRALLNEKKGKYEKSLEDINQIIVIYPDFSHAINEKARVLLLKNEWDESLATCQRALKKDPSDIEALRISMLYYMTRESRVDTIKSKVQDLIDAVDKNEPKNHSLYYELSQLCSRLANRRAQLLNLTIVMIEKALKLINSASGATSSGRSSYLTELGYQTYLQGEIQQSLSSYQEASKMEEGNLYALYGSIRCKIQLGKLKEAEQELEFLKEIQQTTLPAIGETDGSGAGGSADSSTAELMLLYALLSWQKDFNETKTMEYLQQCIDLHSRSLQSKSPGYEYFIHYNPDFVMEIVQQYSIHLGGESIQQGDLPSPHLSACISLLRTFTSLVPGNIEGSLYLSRMMYLNGDLGDAENLLNNILRNEGSSGSSAQSSSSNLVFAKAHLLQSQIFLARDQYKQCSQVLEQSRSLDFEIRNTPIYHLMKGKLLEMAGQTDDAIKVLQSAMDLPGVKKVVPPSGAASSNKPKTAPVPLADRLSIYLCLASLYQRQNNLDACNKLLAESKSEFKSSREYDRILLAESDLLVKKKDIDGALNVLKTVEKASFYYTRSKMKASQIYLIHKKNKRMYAASYIELAQLTNTAHSYILLGEAMMRISEPEKAIKAYETALKLDPTNASLTSKIGGALITTHDYARAVQYYVEAASDGDGNKIFLLHELADLYLSLKQHQDALRILERAVEVSKNRTLPSTPTLDVDLSRLLDDCKSYQLQADVYLSAFPTQSSEEILNKLTKAYEIQGEVLNRIRGDNVDLKKEQRESMGTICYRIALYYHVSSNNIDKAQLYLNESLKHSDSNEKARMMLAKICMIQGDLEGCQNHCQIIQRADPDHREASMMLADLMFKRNEPESATTYFQSLLEKNPVRYEALVKLLQLLKRAGKLQTEGNKFIKAAEKFSAAASFSAGLHYCKGLLAWYMNDPREALIQFNYSRKDNEYGSLSMFHMIEIYLNPDNTELFTESSESKGDNTEQLYAAEKLLQELNKLGESSQQYHILSCYFMFATKAKPNIERALDELQTLLTQSPNYIPALLAQSVGLILLEGKNSVKAKNLLKKIAKTPFDPDFATEFERAWLLLADNYIDVGKYEFATDLCKKCLGNNKSSAKSWEMLGTIMEKEQAWADAAEDYEQAWVFMNQSSPSIGYKLAFNYLKARRYVEAINVCHKVLQLVPEYPKIRKEILDKARMGLRT